MKAGASTPLPRRDFISRLREYIQIGDFNGIRGFLKVFRSSDVDLSSKTPVELSNEYGTPSVSSQITDRSSSSSALSTILSTGGTLLHEACSADFDQSIIESLSAALIDHGIPISTSDDKGNTALHIVAKRGFDTVGRFLIMKGAAECLMVIPIIVD